MLGIVQHPLREEELKLQVTETRKGLRFRLMPNLPLQSLNLAFYLSLVLRFDRRGDKLACTVL